MNLIPADYSRRLSLLRSLRRFAALYLLLALLLTGGRLALSHGIEQHGAQIAAANRARAELSRQRSELAELRRRDELLQGYLDALDGLRGGTAAQDVLRLVDRALNPGVWFSEWRFSRAGERADADSGAVRAGYFIVLPASPGDDESTAWRLRSRMQLRAHALDHAAMADFMRRLGEQPRVASVRLLSSQRGARGAALDFDLALVLRPPAAAAGAGW